MAPKKIRYGFVTTPPIEEFSLPNRMKSPSSLLWPWDCALSPPAQCVQGLGANIISALWVFIPVLYFRKCSERPFSTP